MVAKRDLASEIEEIRERTGPSEWDNGITKLLFLCIAVEKLTEESEQQSYFPVACIAALEVYFRWEIRNLIDSDDVQYIDNIRVDDLPLKIDHDLLVAIHGKRITVGELIAHAVRLNTLDSINKVMGQLLKVDFIDLVKDARDPDERRERGENASLVLNSIGDTLTKVKRTLELRHIICHEAHLDVPAKLDEIKELCSACYSFARASRYGIAHHVNPAAPLTLSDAYQEAKDRVTALEKQMTELENAIVRPIAGSPLEEPFKAMQEAWKASVEQEAAFIARHHMNMGRGALYGELTKEEMYKIRLPVIKKYAENR